MISSIKFALVSLLKFILAPLAPLAILFARRRRGSALEERSGETDSRTAPPPSDKDGDEPPESIQETTRGVGLDGDDPESLAQWLHRAKTILAGYRRDFGPDAWLTKKQAEYVRELERVSTVRNPNDGPRMADGV